MATRDETTGVPATEQLANPWGSSLDKLREWDPKGAELLLRVSTNPWTSGVLPRKEVELIYLALCSSCTTRDDTGTRRQIRASLAAGATRDEILVVLKCCVAPAVHSCSLGAPILLEEMKAAGVKPAGGPKPETPACDAMRAMGQWSTARYPSTSCRRLDGSVFRPRGEHLQERGLHAKIHRADEHRGGRLRHAHVCARRPAPYQSCTSCGGDAGRDHDCAPGLRFPWRSSMC